MAGKSLLKEITGFWNKKVGNKHGISASKALTLQQEYLMEGACCGHGFQEPFLTIIPLIGNESAEVADAAFFYLKKIAQVSPQLAESIVNSLEEYARNKRLDKAVTKRFMHAGQEIRETMK